MSLAQHVLQRLTLGDVGKGNCNSHLYHSCICSERSEYIGAYKNSDYYTYWSYIWFWITLIITIISIPLSKKFFKSSLISRSLNYFIYPLMVAGISNSIAIGLVSQMLFTNLKIDTPDEDKTPEAIDFYGISSINISNFWLHIIPLFISFIIIFLFKFIKVDTKRVTYFRLFITSIIMTAIFFLTWILIPIDVTTKSGSLETVLGIKKLEYTYSIPPWYIYITFPLTIILSISLICYELIYK